MEKLNFLIFVTDQMQSDSLGCNGNREVRTPAVDALAKEGTTFTRAYCNNPVCSPSRATMITGLTSRQHGLITNGTLLPENIPTLTSALVQSGYRTHSVGKQHLQPYGIVEAKGKTRGPTHSWEERNKWLSGEIQKMPEPYYGFQTQDFVGGHGATVFGEYVNWLNRNHPGTLEKFRKEKSYEVAKNVGECWKMDVPAELHYNHWVADRTIGFLDSLSQNENFFLWCSFPDPHHPFTACKPYSDMYDPTSLTPSPTANALNGRFRPDSLEPAFSEEFDLNALRAIIAQTYGMISHIDDNVARVLDHLKRKQLYEKTVIVFMSDHGEYLGGHHLLRKNFLPYEEVIRVPYVWRVPGAKKAGTVSPDVVSLLDFVPTILEYAQISPELFNIRKYHNSDWPGLPGRSLKDSLDLGTSLPSRPALIEHDEDWVKGRMCRSRVLIEGQFKLAVFGRSKNGMLYDLEKDPFEETNLWEEPAYRTVREDLIFKLLDENVWTDRLDSERICGA